MQLHFGVLPGVRGVNYCDEHALVVRVMFHVHRETDPAEHLGIPCGARTVGGTPCRRLRIPFEDACPTHVVRRVVRAA